MNRYRVTNWSAISILMISASAMMVACSSDTPSGGAGGSSGSGTGGTGGSSGAGGSDGGGAKDGGGGTGGGSADTGSDVDLAAEQMRCLASDANPDGCAKTCSCTKCTLLVNKCFDDPHCAAIVLCAQSHGCSDSTCGTANCAPEITANPTGLTAATAFGMCYQMNCQQCSEGGAGDASSETSTDAHADAPSDVQSASDAHEGG